MRARGGGTGGTAEEERGDHRVHAVGEQSGWVSLDPVEGDVSEVGEKVHHGEGRLDGELVAEGAVDPLSDIHIHREMDLRVRLQVREEVFAHQFA